MSINTLMTYMWQMLNSFWSLTNCYLEDPKSSGINLSFLLLEIDEVLSYWGCNIKASTVLCFKPLSQVPVWEWEKIAH